VLYCSMSTKLRQAQYCTKVYCIKLHCTVMYCSVQYLCAVSRPFPSLGAMQMSTWGAGTPAQAPDPTPVLLPQSDNSLELQTVPPSCAPGGPLRHWKVIDEAASVMPVSQLQTEESRPV